MRCEKQVNMIREALDQYDDALLTRRALLTVVEECVKGAFDEGYALALADEDKYDDSEDEFDVEFRDDDADDDDDSVIDLPFYDFDDDDFRADD